MRKVCLIAAVLIGLLLLACGSPAPAPVSETTPAPAEAGSAAEPAEDVVMQETADRKSVV